MGNLTNKCLEVFDGNRRFDLSKEDNENGLSQEKSLNSSKNKYKKHNYYNINDILAPASNEIRPSLTKKTSDYINKLYSILSSQGDVSKNLEEYSPNNWQLYYPSDDEFFLFSKGDVYQKQIRIKNEDDINNIEIYEGEINDKNMKHGYGILTNSHYVLKGTWRDDEFTGWGIKCKRNGDNLEGKFIKGELNGKGIFKNGNDIYIGDFINNERYGIGDLTTDKFHYKGEFKNNKLEGKGEIEFFEDGICYKGTFSDNKINGKGIYKWKNGDIYEGEMKNGKMNGFGKYTYSDGKIYEGEYVNDIKKGKGKLSYPGLKSYEGNFVNGEIDGEVICTENDDNYSRALFSNGQFIKYL